MSNWVFIDLPAAAIEGLSEPEFPFPIRRENVAAYERYAAGEFPIFLVADELDQYLDEFPGRVDRYRRPGSHVAMCAGIDACMEGCTEHSLDYYRLAVFLDPENLTARMNYAVALHSLERRAEAIEQYRAIMARGGLYDWWRAWMLCAEALMRLAATTRRWRYCAMRSRWFQTTSSSGTRCLSVSGRPSLAARTAASPTKNGLRFCGFCGRQAILALTPGLPDPRNQVQQGDAHQSAAGVRLHGLRVADDFAGGRDQRATRANRGSPARSGSPPHGRWPAPMASSSAGSSEGTAKLARAAGSFW